MPLRAIERRRQLNRSKHRKGNIVLSSSDDFKRSKITPWSLDVDAFRPDEVPPMRRDDPEDKFDFSWMYGYSGGNGVANSVDYTAGHNIVYGASNYAMLATMTAAEGDGEEAEEGAAPSGTWSQRAFVSIIFP